MPIENKIAPGGLGLFAELVVRLGNSTGTNDKLDALSDYFGTAPAPDRVWVIALFSGRRPKRTINATQLQVWCREVTALPAWLFEECYHTVGDLAETIALLLPEEYSDNPREANSYIFEKSDGSGESVDAKSIFLTGQSEGSPRATLSYYLERLKETGKEPEQAKKEFIIRCWSQMNKDERFVFNKLITGGFRIGVSQKLMVNALSKTTGISAPVIAHRLSGNWDPSHIRFEELLSEDTAGSDISRPYPFYLAYALEENLQVLGDPDQWQAEWKWDGIRGELVKRAGQLFVWSRGEELMTEKFPEYQPLGELLPDGTVIDGEIIGFDTGPVPAAGPGELLRPLPFAALQTRIGRKQVTKKHLQEVPVGFIAYDLLEYEGQDLRSRPLAERRALLGTIVRKAGHPLLALSPLVGFTTWEELSAHRSGSRERGSEGIMLKRKNSTYQVGRKRGDWWKWKVDPLVIDAVLVYAQKGHGRRSNLYTDYTFAVRDGDKLVTFAKAYSGLTDQEIAEVDSFVKKNSIEKFGPVRTVRPELVFEIAFEGIAASGRHKSGVALRFPRINRWRRDKKPDEINTLDDLRQILHLYGKKG